MKTLITGASGLLGNHLTRMFLSMGHQVRVLLEDANTDTGLEGLKIEKFIDDIREPVQVKGCASGADVVIHAAADTTVWPERSQKVHEINVLGTKHLIEEAFRAQVKRFIYVSSASVFDWGSGHSPGTESSGKFKFNYRISYYESKRLAQEMVLKAVRDRNLPGIVVNPTFMLGPHDYKMNGARLVSSILDRKVPGYPPGGRNFIHAKDVATAIYNAIKLGTPGECYILGNENLAYREFFKRVGAVSQRSVPGWAVPGALVRLTGLLQSWIASVSGSSPLISYNMARGSCQEAYYCSEKAIKHLRLPQTPISEAIQDTIDWLEIRKPLLHKDMNGKVVLVTGSTSGLGRNLAMALLRMGAHLCINGRDREKLEETCKLLKLSGGKVISFRGDVSRPDDCQSMIRTCVEYYGKLDVLINNAGTGGNGLFGDTLPDAARKVIETNLFGSIYPTYYALPHVVRSRGSIVFISSLAGIHGLPFNSSYCASKMALTSLAQSLRIELEGTGVHTGIIYVGFLKNGPRKMIIGSHGHPVPAAEKPKKFSMSMERTSLQIIRAIEKRRALRILSFLGKFLYFCNWIAPGFVRKILSLSMTKMKSAYTPMPQVPIHA